MNRLKQILMLCTPAAGVVLKYVPGSTGIAIAGILGGIGFLASLTHPTPAAVKAFGESAK